MPSRRYSYKTPFSAFHSPQADVPWEQRKRHDSPHAWDPALIQPLKLSITLSPYASIASPLFLRSLRDGAAASYWLSLQPRVGGCSVRDPPPAPEPEIQIKAEYVPAEGEERILLCWGQTLQVQSDAREQLFSCFMRKQLSNFHFQKTFLEVASVQKIPPNSLFSSCFIDMQICHQLRVFLGG